MKSYSADGAILWAFEPSFVQLYGGNNQIKPMIFGIKVLMDRNA